MLLRRRILFFFLFVMSHFYTKNIWTCFLCFHFQTITFKTDLRIMIPPGRISDWVIEYSGCTTRSLKFQMPPLLLISRWRFSMGRFVRRGHCGRISATCSVLSVLSRSKQAVAEIIWRWNKLNSSFVQNSCTMQSLVLQNRNSGDVYFMNLLQFLSL